MLNHVKKLVLLSLLPSFTIAMEEIASSTEAIRKILQEDTYRRELYLSNLSKDLQGEILKYIATSALESAITIPYSTSLESRHKLTDKYLNGLMKILAAGVNPNILIKKVPMLLSKAFVDRPLIIYVLENMIPAHKFPMRTKILEELLRAYL